MNRRSGAAAAASLALAATYSTGTLAKDDLLETLAQKGVINADEYQKLKAGQQATAKAIPSFSADKGLTLATGDGTDTLRFGIFQQIDFAAFDDDGSDLSDGTQLRRSRLSLAGQLDTVWQYRFQYEFAKGSAAITDAYVSYSGFTPFLVTFGQAKLPFSMESLSAAAGTTFMERGLPAYIISPILRAPGVQAAWSASHGSLAASVTSDPLGNSAAGDEGWGVAARASFAPILAAHRVVHLGAGVNWRKLAQDNSGTPPSSSSIAFAAKPSSAQAPNFLSSGALLDTTSYRLTNAEFASAFGAASLQSEYLWINVARNNGRDDLAFQSWYAQLAYTLTGEARAYSVGKGVFAGIKPAHPLGAGGWGAFETAARVSQLDLNDGSISGGNTRDLTLGLSWYPNPFLRVSANYVKVLKLDGGAHAGDKPSIYQMRLQFSI